MNRLPTQRKIDAVAELSEKMSRTQFTVVADYRGLTVAEITALRTQLREAGAEFVVAKNTLTLLAAKENGLEGLEPMLEGPTALAFAYDDVAKAAKVLNEFARTSKKLQVRGGMLGKNVLAANALEQVASMPSREQVLAQIVGGVSAPVSGVVGVLNAAVTNVLYALQARIDQQQGAEAA